MNKIKIKYTDEEFIMFIKTMLCLDGGVWTNHIIDSLLTIETKGNPYKVQKAIYEWLSVPARKNNFKLLGGKQ